jgi:hypothetical protein
VDGQIVDVPAGKQRALLTLLALRAAQPLDGLLLMRITRPVPKAADYLPRIEGAE